MWNKLNKSMMVCQMSFGLSYYGVMAILTRFFLEKLNYSEENTMMIVGSFSAIAPLFAIVGGLISDKLLGNFRSLSLSFFGFTIGYILLLLGANTPNVMLCLLGIALVSYSRGLMLPNYPGLFKNTFDTTEQFEDAYPVNYSVNNLGAFLGLYLFPLLLIVIGFKGGFVLSSIMAVIAFSLLKYLRNSFKQIGSELDKNPVGLKNWTIFVFITISLIGLVYFMFSNMNAGKNIVYVLGSSAILYFLALMVKVNYSERLKMCTILIMVFLSTIFFIYYAQMMTSMNLVAIKVMRGDLFGFIPIAPEGSMSMNPLWCIIAGPVIAFFTTFLERKNIHLQTATKVSFSFVLTFFAFGLLTFAVKNIETDLSLSPEVFLIIHFFQAFAEVIVGSLVVVFILSVAPKNIENFSVSLFHVSMALSGMIGAQLSTSIALNKNQELSQEIIQKSYGNFFGELTFYALIMVGVALVSTYFIKKILAQAEKKSKIA